MPTSIQYVNVGSGQLLSSAFAIGRAHSIAVIFPTLDAGNVLLQGGISQVGSFFRMATISSGPVQFVAASAAVVIDPLLMPMPFARFEFLVSQSAVRSLTVISRI